MSTSSEKYEAAQDEVDSLILRIQEDIALTQAATSAEEKKKLNQVSILVMMLKQETESWNGLTLIGAAHGSLFISELLL